MANLGISHLMKYLSNFKKYTYMMISVDNTIFPFQLFIKGRFTLGVKAVKSWGQPNQYFSSLEPWANLKFV